MTLAQHLNTFLQSKSSRKVTLHKVSSDLNEGLPCLAALGQVFCILFQ